MVVSKMEQMKQNNTRVGIQVGLPGGDVSREFVGCGETAGPLQTQPQPRTPTTGLGLDGHKPAWSLTTGKNLLVTKSER